MGLLEQPKHPFARLSAWVLLLALLLAFGMSSTSCVTAYRRSVGGETAQVFQKIYLTDFNTAWQASLDSIKHASLDVSNREAGFIQTKWAENTAEKNFVDSFGSQDSYLKAQFRFRISVSKGFYNGQPSVKVAVQKEQLVQRDVLEGWKPIESDSIDENTLLYRIGRIIHVRMKIAYLEEQKTKRAIEEAGFPSPDPASANPSP